MIALLSMICLVGMIVNFLMVVFAHEDDPTTVVFYFVTLAFAVAFQFLQGLM